MRNLIKAVEELRDTSNVSADRLKKLTKVKRKLESAIQKAQDELKPLRDSRLSEKAFNEALAFTKSVASNVFSTEIQLATSRTIEYNQPEFKFRLLELANEEALFEFTPTPGTGWSRNISVSLRMDEVAGDINDYGVAVIQSRDKLRVNEKRNPDRSSKYWKEKVWGHSAYKKTISTRFSFMNGKAPFWSLLNYGTASANMPSDIGGSPYPKVRGTRFVERTRNRLYRIFREAFTSDRANNKAQRDELSSKISGYKSIIRDVDNLILEWSNEFGRNNARAKSLANKLGVSITDNDADILLKAIQDYVQGNISGRTKIQFGGSRYTVSSLSKLDY